MKNSTKKKETKFPVREGKEDSSILHDKKASAKNTWPQLEKQVKNQPEFIEEQPNRKNPDNL